MFVEEGGFPYLADQEGQIQGPGIPRPDFVGAHWPFWENLEELLAYPKSQRLDVPQSKLIQAIKCPECAARTEVQPGFVALGYDVADVGYISSLSNCGFNREEWTVLRRDFRQAVNAFHLFEEWSTAKEYSKRVSKLSPEHAPFEPYLIAWSV